LLHAPGSVDNDARGESGVGFFFCFRSFARAAGGVKVEGVGEVQAIEFVAAFRGAVLQSVLPDLLVVVLLLLVPGRAGREINGLGVG
jgi:hypothetical protein